jgi:hypothetical protein
VEVTLAVMVEEGERYEEEVVVAKQVEFLI